MVNLKELEDLRTKEELIEYFNAKGINITDAQIENLKSQYEQVETNKNVLTQKQLDEVAGGLALMHVEAKHYTPEQKEAILRTYGNGKGNILGVTDLGEKGLMFQINDGKEDTSYLNPTEVKITKVKAGEEAGITINGMQLNHQNMGAILAVSQVIYHKGENGEEHNAFSHMGIGFNPVVDALRAKLDNQELEQIPVGFTNFEKAVKKHAKISNEAKLNEPTHRERAASVSLPQRTTSESARPRSSSLSSLNSGREVSVDDIMFKLTEREKSSLGAPGSEIEMSNMGENKHSVNDALRKNLESIDTGVRDLDGNGCSLTTTTTTVVNRSDFS